MAPKNFAGLTSGISGALGGLAGLLPLGGALSVPSYGPCRCQQQHQCLQGRSPFEQFLAQVQPLQLAAWQQQALAGIAALRPKRPARPWALWQFANGKTAPMSGPRDLPTPESGIEWFMCYDRSLGMDVVYAAR